MKHTLYTLFTLFILSATTAFAQDDMTDTRRKTELFAKLPKGQIRGEVSRFTLSGVDEAVGKEELKKLTTYSVEQNTLILKGDTVKALITIAAFDPAKHKLDYDEKWLIKIDRKTYYGGYPALPKTSISSVNLIIGKDSVAVPAAAYSDLYNLNFTYKDKAGVSRSRSGIFTSKDGKRMYLYLFCKDNTGNYEVTYIFENKKYVRRVLDYGFMN